MLLMCSCNDCSRKGGWGGGGCKGETDGCLRVNSLKEIKALKARFSIFRRSPPTPNTPPQQPPNNPPNTPPETVSSSSEVTPPPTRSLPLTLEA